MTHPDQVLFENSVLPVLLPSCVHYAGREEFLHKALLKQRTVSYAFDVTADCEDGAPVGKEREHLAMVISLFGQAAGQRLGVRIHDLESPHWQYEAEELLRVVGSELAYLVIPKIKNAAQVRQLIRFLRFRVAALGLAAVPPLHLLIETASAVEELPLIARFPEVQSLDFGLMDFISEAGGAIPATCMRSPGQFSHQLLIHAKTRLVHAAMLYGKTATHNVTLALKDSSQVYQDAFRARNEFGFMRMWSIHPEQIEPIVEAMRPSFEEVALAETVLLKAAAAGWGPIAHEGELYDRASYRFHWQLLKRATSAGVALGEEISELFF